MLKRYHLLVIMLLMPPALWSQELLVKGFEAVNDFVSENDWRKDLDGDYCALVRVCMLGDIEHVEGNIVGNVIDRGNEKWMFLTTGTKSFRLFIQDKLPLDVNCKDYGFKDLKGKTVYILTIDMPQTAKFASPPLILKDSTYVKKNKDWFFIRLDIDVIKSTAIQNQLSMLFFGIKEKSLELAYRKYLSSHDEIKKQKKGVKTPKAACRDSYQARCNTSTGCLINVIATIESEQIVKKATKVQSSQYSFIYNQREDKIIDLNDIFQLEVGEKIKELTGDTLAYQIELWKNGIGITLHKKTKDSLPDERTPKKLLFKYSEVPHLFQDSFLEDVDTNTSNKSGEK